MGATMKIPNDRVFRDRKIAISRLLPRYPETAEDMTLSDLAFEDCHIIGPAVLAVLDAEVTLSTLRTPGPHTTTRESVEGILWPWPNYEEALGCIAVQRCRFDHCTFDLIGFTGPAHVLDGIRRHLFEDA